MKHIASLIIAAFLTTTSCTTTSTGKHEINPNTADKIAPILAATVATAVVYAYNKDQNSALYIAAIRSFLFEFLESTNLNASDLQSKLYDLPIKELKTEVAQLIIAPVIAAYKIFGEQLARDGYNSQEGLRILVRALIDGVGIGLQTIGKSQKELPAMFYPSQERPYGIPYYYIQPMPYTNFTLPYQMPYQIRPEDGKWLTNMLITNVITTNWLYTPDFVTNLVIRTNTIGL